MHYGSDVNEKEKKKKEKKREMFSYPDSRSPLLLRRSDHGTAILSMEDGTEECTIKNCNAEIRDM